MRPLGFGETANGYEKAVSWLAFPDWGQGLTATFFVQYWYRSEVVECVAQEWNSSYPYEE